MGGKEVKLALEAISPFMSFISLESSSLDVLAKGTDINSVEAGYKVSFIL